MRRKQLITLALYSLGMYVMGNMAITLLPVYAVQRGMNESMVGIYFALAFSLTTIGAFVGGWLSNRFQRRKLTLIVVSVIGIPATYLMGQSHNLTTLTLFTLIDWFIVGIAVAVLNILVGMYAQPHERGRIFGMIATMIALGQVIGAFVCGAVVQRWGFPALYSLTALAWLAPLIAALFIQDDQRIIRPKGQPKPAAVPLGRAVSLMIVATILASISGNIAGLARPLTMNLLGFDANAISSAASVSGLVALPLPFLVGWLSDRTGRRQVLLASYIVTCLGMLVLIGALNLGQFWLSGSLMALAGGAGGVASALLTDLAPAEAQGTALARFSATPWIAAIIGFGATGVVIQTLGLAVTLLIGAALPLSAIALLLWSTRRSLEVVPA